MESWVSTIEFERCGALRRALKTALINPAANYVPAAVLKALLTLGKSKLAAANWENPGGWKSMVISYAGSPTQIADKLLVNGGTIPMALRNRRRLASTIIARLIDQSDNEPAHVLCLGAGPGRIIIDAIAKAKRKAHATLVDLNSDAFEYGKQIAAQAGVADQVRYIRGDVRNVKQMLDRPPDIVKMLGICEYLTDGEIVDITSVAAGVMPPDSPVVFNSLSMRHGTDRFFRRVFGLHMRHRSPEQLESLISAAGFHDFTAFSEPLGVYQVVVGRRNSPPTSDASKGPA